MEEITVKALEILKSVEGASVTVAIVLDVVFRMIPSKKPLSVLYVIAEGIGAVGKVLVKIAEVADKVLPQKIKEE